MKNVLITGGAGFVGYHLANDLASNGYRVTILDKFSNDKMDAMLYNLITRYNVHPMKFDLTDPGMYKQLDESYDYVYHLAAINGTRLFYEIPKDVVRTNTLSTINILDWFEKSGSGKILFTSSSETYAGTIGKFGYDIPTPEVVPLCIEDVKNPRWSYGGSKIIGELLFANYMRQDNINMSIVRLHNIYGARMGNAHVIPEFLIRSYRREDPFVINGNATRSFCYIDDVVNALKLVMESAKTNGEIINIGDDREEITMENLAKLIFDITGYTPNITIKPSPAGSVDRRCPDITKLKELVGYAPTYMLKDGLKLTHKYYSCV